MAELDPEALRATQPLIEEIAVQVAREFTLDSLQWDSSPQINCSPVVQRVRLPTCRRDTALRQ